MKKILIAFDIDGTILNNEGLAPGTPLHQRFDCGVNLAVVQLLILLATSFKNVTVICWSGGGKDYAEQVVRKYGLTRYVKRCYGKQEYDETIAPRVDIAIDDVHACDLADKNLIVKMK